MTRNAPPSGVDRAGDVRVFDLRGSEGLAREAGREFAVAREF
jgi:hypothetical protein